MYLNFLSQKVSKFSISGDAHICFVITECREDLGNLTCTCTCSVCAYKQTVFLQSETQLINSWHIALLKFAPSAVVAQ